MSGGSDTTVLSAMRRLDAAAPGCGRSVTEIALLAGLDFTAVRSSLLRLMLRGVVGRTAGGRFALFRSRHLAHGNDAA